MYLFLFAFLGNLFYVLSILTSPKVDLPEPQARQFIRDSVPYVLAVASVQTLCLTYIHTDTFWVPVEPFFLMLRFFCRVSCMILGDMPEDSGAVGLEEGAW
jgi:hypothetical protein